MINIIKFKTWIKHNSKYHFGYWITDLNTGKRFTVVKIKQKKWLLCQTRIDNVEYNEVKKELGFYLTLKNAINAGIEA